MHTRKYSSRQFYTVLAAVGVTLFAASWLTVSFFSWSYGTPSAEFYVAWLVSSMAFGASAWRLSRIVRWHWRIIGRLDQRAARAIAEASRLRRPEVVAEMFAAEFRKALLSDQASPTS